MKIVYISSYCSMEMKKDYELRNGTRLSPPAYNFNKKVVEGFEENEIEVFPLISFPTMIEDSKFLSSKRKGIGFVFDVFNQISKEYRKDSKLVVVGDCLCAKAMIAAVLFKVIKRIKLIGIITDLPEYIGNEKRKTISNFVYVWMVYFVISKSDALVCLTKELFEKFKTEKKGIVIEGFSEYNGFQKQEHKLTRVVYSGSIQKAYGLLNLMESINEMGDSLVLEIYSTEDEYEEFTNLLSSNVINKGYIEYEKLKEVLVNADILVNPRLLGNEYTKYSFPSKILEYMSSGTITITTKLPGIPPEYDDYLNYFEGDSSNDISEGLKTITLNYDYYKNKATRAKAFVNAEKGKKKQSSRIIEMINELQKPKDVENG